MSGIVGTISPFKRADISYLHKALNSISHRGPDGNEIESGQWGMLGANILHVASKDKKPIITKSRDSKVMLAMDGTFLNYKDIRENLKSEGIIFQTNSSREVLLNFYLKKGVGFIKHFIGESSIVIIDTKKKKILLLRDFFGVRPLYYQYKKGKLYFASEIKAILKLNPTPPKINREALLDYVTFQYSLDSKTLFSDIYKIQPGCYLEWDYLKNNEPQLKTHWKLKFNVGSNYNEKYFIQKTKYLIQDSIERNLNIDEPVGIYLSGGLDSSTVASFAKKLSPTLSFRSFSGKYKEGKNFDESLYAKCVAKAIKSKHLEVIPKAEEFPSLIKKIIYLMDEPQGGPGVFGQYVVGREAAKYVKVAFSGEGGDEVFLGYAKYLMAYLEECIRGAIFETADQKAFVATLQSISPNLPLLKTYTNSLKHFWQGELFNNKEKRYFDLCNRLAGTEEIFSPDIFKMKYNPKEHFTGILNSCECKSHINIMSRFDILIGLPAVLQVDDRTSMGHSIENRVPLMDRGLIEFIASTPPTIKFRGGKQKYLLRKAIVGVVPNQVLSRKDKMGFPIPINQWFAGPLKNFVHDILLSRKSKERSIFNKKGLSKILSSQHSAYSRLLWGVLNLELWFQTFIDSN